MSVAAVVVAGGRGTRFGGPKQFARLDDETVAARSVRHARSVASLVVLVAPEGYDGNGEGADVVVTGGPSRAASVRAGLAFCGDAEIVVVHDAARPLATDALFVSVVEAVRDGADAAVPGLPITDTVKNVEGSGATSLIRATVARDGLVTVQTPQAFRRELLVEAHASAPEATDDAALVEALGARVVVIPGEVANIKITQPGDLERASAPPRLGSMRVGYGFDVHRVSDDPARVLMLGLIEIGGAPGLVGHSDADVATHALCDALLGAANLGDLLRIVRGEGFTVTSGDITIVAEQPRLSNHMAQMSGELSALVGVTVSVKATTAEGLGALGRVEGIAATAVVLIERTP
ncbi:MAG: 2-C-methyl-D-erythritol 2,4-cyclodiphosphate synthase [Acidimicrobiales bacterium]